MRLPSPVPRCQWHFRAASLRVMRGARHPPHLFRLHSEWDRLAARAPDAAAADSVVTPLFGLSGAAVRPPDKEIADGPDDECRCADDHDGFGGPALSHRGLPLSCVGGSVTCLTALTISWGWNGFCRNTPPSTGRGATGEKPVA